MVNVKAGLSKQYNRLFEIVPPAAIRAVDIKLSAIPDIIRLTIGEPDFAVPMPVKEAVKTAIDNDDSHYAPAKGLLPLRQAISTYVHERFSTPVYDPESEIAVTIGASEAIYDALSALFNRGETILVPTPTFCFYQAEALRLGLNVVEINTAPNYLFTAEMFKQAMADHPEAKGLILNYPGNPTGVTYPEETLKELAQVIDQTDVLVMSDEIYGELTYGRQHKSISAYIPEQTIFISGLSKSHAMTGYRVGFIAGPAALMKMVCLAHSGVVTTAPTPMMDGALAALTVAKDAPAAMRDVYHQRRDLVLAGLAEAGFSAPKPEGAFYIFATIPDFLNQNDEEFVYELGEQAGVGAIPGTVFGDGGQGHIRISYAASTEDLTEAMRRLVAFSQAARAEQKQAQA
ncbi:aminotransferase class I/II-fold pyridoxal phosphate-dependent enzyme [Fructobacillus ficulneus]|uniref:Aminotransferase n=1 Tax=Fructobacillus ficulneus TaxID=157463 RepID=A0A0K8MIA0_9LACO|nr:aminotransferase class I/II-fold pyridoxal phosphate-dependent enzyme [Fructobacillus ficulneus]GAP00183.1 putative aspartate transaminase [Fructobacillus ficulneus]